MMTDIAVLIVSYNPDKRLLYSIKRIKTLFGVSSIIVIDNTEGYNSVVSKVEQDKTIILHKNGKNLGIATAQNIGIKKLWSLGYNWVLTLDQDTIIKQELINKYIGFLRENDCSNIGILCSDYFDIGSKKIKYNNSIIKYLKETISSGSLLNLSVCISLGGMKDVYIIDQVDNEYCYRVNKKGYKIVLLPGADMEHRLGKMKQYSFLGKTFFVYNQPPIRTFYRTRNSILFLREYRDTELTIYKSRELVKDFLRIIFEKETIKKYRMFFKGLREGLHIKI